MNQSQPEVNFYKERKVNRVLATTAGVLIVGASLLGSETSKEDNNRLMALGIVYPLAVLGIHETLARHQKTQSNIDNIDQ